MTEAALNALLVYIRRESAVVHLSMRLERSLGIEPKPLHVLAEESAEALKHLRYAMLNKPEKDNV